MRVLMIRHALADDANEADRDVLIQAEAITASLVSLGHTVEHFVCSLDLEALRQRLEDDRPDVVFQLVEVLAGSDSMPVAVTSLLDALHVPYTGASTAGLLLTNHKLLAKERFCQFGIPTPGWGVLNGHNTLRWHDRQGRCCSPAGLAIVKAVGEHASFGLEEDSVVRQPAEIAGRLAEAIHRRRRPYFAEEFIDGREFNVSILGQAGASSEPDVLPPAEIDFSTFPPGKVKLVGYRAKWAEGTFEYDNTPRTFELPASDGPLLQRLRDIAGRCWHAFGLRGYVRVDFRVSTDGEPLVLEINTNPCISPEGGFAAAVQQGGFTYTEAIGRILAQAGGPQPAAC